MALFTSFLKFHSLITLFVFLPSHLPPNNFDSETSSPVLKEAFSLVEAPTREWKPVQPDGMVVYQDWKAIAMRIEHEVSTSF